MKGIAAKFLIALLACCVYAKTRTVRVYDKIADKEFFMYDSIQEFNESRKGKFSTHIYNGDLEIYEVFELYTVGFWQGGDYIDYIKLKSDNLSLEMDGKEILFFHRTLSDIESQLGTDYHRPKNFNNRIEYMFKTNRPLYNIYIAFHFDNGKCIAVEIYDDGRFV